MTIEPTYIYRATCHRIIDGDSVVLQVALGFNVSAHVTVRVRGVNAPERSKPGGSEATEFLREFLADDPLLVQSYRDRMSFARWIADVWLLDVDGPKSVAAALIAAGHGVAYP